MTHSHDTRTESGSNHPHRHVFERHVAEWADRFNRADSAGLDELYEDDGILVPVPGHPVGGRQRAAANAHLMRLGVPMRARLRRCYLAGDIALLVIDWSVSGTAPDGQEVAMSGTATDVLRRGGDGQWRVVIDNPSGTG